MKPKNETNAAADTKGANSALTPALHHHLDTHGHAFQYRVLQATERLFEEGVGRQWSFEVAEQPVVGTHIDFVLTHQADDITFYLVVECKRSNPAYASWVFLKTPYTRHGESGYTFIAEGLQKSDWPHNAQRVPFGVLCGERQSLDHAAELKTPNTRGDDCTEGRGALAKAVEQVLRGVYGLSQLLGECQRQRHFPTEKAVFIPVIVTTAAVYSGEIDPTAVSIEDGSVDKSSLDPQPESFVFHSHNASPDLQGGASPVATGLHGLAPMLDNEFRRTIAVVRSSSLREFFTEFSPVPKLLAGVQTARRRNP